MNTAMTHSGNYVGNFKMINVQWWKLYINKTFGVDGLTEQFEPAKRFDGVRGPFVEVPASKFARVFKCSVGFAGRCRNLYLKQYFYRSAWDFVKHLFRPSRAERAFRAAIMLEENGLGSPDVVAMGELRYGPFCVNNLLITRHLADAEDICVYLLEKLKGQTDGILADRRRFIASLGKTIGWMHAAGIFHGDLRPRNIFAKKSEDNWEFFLLDNERTKQFRRLPSRLRLKNLVQINMFREGISRTDRFRFYKAYLEQNTMVVGNPKILAVKISSKTNSRLQKK